MPQVEHKKFGNKNSKESQAAEILARKLRMLDANGSILVISNLSLPGGEDIKDIDILVIGYLQDYIIYPFTHFKDKDGNIERLKVKSFCFTIELKRTCFDDAEITELGDIKVDYWDKNDSDVLDQSIKQKYALKNVLKRTKQISPWITNLIWMYNIEENTVQFPHTGWNVLFGDFDIETLFITAANHEQLNVDRYNHNEAVFYSFPPDKLDKELASAFDLFLKSKKPQDNLSRQKFEYITNRAEKVIVEKIGKLNIIKGRAGTGKTIQLIKFAYKEVIENHKRCLMLTYNNALVGDIRRIATFCDLPDGIEEAFSVQTIHSFFKNLMSANNINLESFETDFNATYTKGLDILLEREEIMNPYRWNYILIDEAQDCTDKEIKLWSKLYGEEQIVIADGVDQFVRKIDFASWEDAFGPDAIHTQELKVSKRQKNNIVSFLNSFAVKTGVDWYVEENDELRGGKVIITNQLDQALVQELKDKLIQADNSMYDMLFLVDSQNGKAAIKTLSNIGIQAYDGTTANKEGKYPVNLNECRVYNYNSCRGLEGWVVICLFMDLFIAEKIKFAPFIAKREFESDNDYKARKLREVYKWLMMPLSRAIDKLVITIYDKESPIAKILKELHEEHKDYVVWDVEQRTYERNNKRP